MNTAIISALAAILGSVVGGTATILTAWMTQRFQSRREFARAEAQKKETLYTEFISECSKLLIDSLDHNLSSPDVLVQVYALVSRMRLTSSEEVVTAAEAAVARIVHRYTLPNLSAEEIASLAKTPQTRDDPLKPFSEACRAELRRLAYA
ncbi:MAG: hypothetical protein U1F54_07755 [Burkholderiales bacterium]